MIDDGFFLIQFTSTSAFSLGGSWLSSLFSEKLIPLKGDTVRGLCSGISLKNGDLRIVARLSNPAS